MFERFTMNARQVVVLAGQAARELNHPYIGTEHLLVALLDDACEGTRAVLRDAGLTRERAVADIRRLAGENAEALGDEDAVALEAIGIDLQAVRAKVEELFGPGALRPQRPTGRRGWLRRRTEPTESSRRFSERAKKVLGLSLREAVALHHNVIAPEHILLGLLRDGGGLAARVLTEAGVDRELLRRRAVESVAKAA